jgi:hypothetical protein
MQGAGSRFKKNGSFSCTLKENNKPEIIEYIGKMVKITLVGKRTVIISAILIGIIGVAPYSSYRVTKFYFNRYFNSWGHRLVDLEKRRVLSRQFGAAWQDVVTQDNMQTKASQYTTRDTASHQGISIVNGVAVTDYPSLSIVGRLNEVRKYSNTITINDRNNRLVARIRTDHTRAGIAEVSPTLIKALIAAEDGRYYDNPLGFEFDSFIRAILKSCWETVTTFSLHAPRGTSTITQQVAKLFISHLDEAGRLSVTHSVDRKARELRLSAALRSMYSADEILEVYLNHCVTSDYGLIGVKDIAKGLFDKEAQQLTDAECVYIARMVKWGRNVPKKISRQCRLDMPRIGAALGWSVAHAKQVLAQIDTMKFSKPKQIATSSGYLVDLANEFWLLYLQKSTGQIPADFENTMNLLNPNSLIRKKGNLTIKLTIDLALQQTLEELVKKRGFGPDTMLYTDLRVGSDGEDISLQVKPTDTVRNIRVMDTIVGFSEKGSTYQTLLNPGDTLISNIRYNKVRSNLWHRACFYYTRKWIKVNGQYFASCIIDSKTGKILAYYSRDRIGSRLACLLKNRIPNGSSTAKPIINALNFDIGNFLPYTTFNDSLPDTTDVPWKKTIQRENGIPLEVVFEHCAVPGQKYTVHNHGSVFEGCQYIFDLLASSNNIFGVEAIYRLNRKVFDDNGDVLPDAYPIAQLLYRINALDMVTRELHLKTVTGVRLYRELCRIVGASVDTVISFGRKTLLSDSLYSVALGTLELSLYEQAHLFNVLYNNTLIETPAKHPGLVIDEIVMNGVAIPVNRIDTIRQYHPFADLNTIRPTLLGMHKRLVSNPGDNLTSYDIAYAQDSVTMQSFNDNPAYSEQQFSLQEPLSNYAKSGTTDDILRPFNVDVISNKRTNYGLWNATVRIDLAKLAGDTIQDVHDITIACVGEGNAAYTGFADGKTLHKYISIALLKRAGLSAENGFFRQYEGYLKKVTLDSMRCIPSSQEENTAVPVQKEFAGD